MFRIVYSRVSSDSPAPCASYDEMLEQMTAWCRANGLRIVAEVQA